MSRPEAPAYRLYGRRQGPALRPRQLALLDRSMPRLAIAPDADLTHPGSLFLPPHERVWLEIGFGGGEHLAFLAGRNPDVGLIGCEAFLNGVVKLLAMAEADRLSNIKVHVGDGRDIVDRLGPGSVERVFLLFPDPWPKRRHHKRRFVSPRSLNGIHRILRRDGRLRFASDSPDYVGHTLREAERHGGFRPLTVPLGECPPTRYQAKAIAAGRECFCFDFVRLP